MSAIDTLKKFQEEQRRSVGWAGLLGKEYFGGTSGKGAYGDLRTVDCELVIYSQERDGDKNYHDAPDLIRKAVNNQIRARFTEILADALLELDAERKEIAKKAQEEYAALMREAGLEVTP